MQTQVRRYLSHLAKPATQTKSPLLYQRTQCSSQFNFQQKQEGNQSHRFSQSMYMLLGAATVSYTANKYFSFKVSSADGSIVEHEIDFASSLDEGQMKELKVGPKDEDKVLIARYQGKLYSVGNYCSHFGAPLSTGLLFDDKVLCPWHAAAFSIITGAIEHAPGMDGLPKFEIIEKDGKFFVLVPSVLPRTQKAEMAKRDPENKKRFVIIGGGPAGLNCAETLRQSMFTGEIVVISDDNLMPYDRTLLSKIVATGDASKLNLREDSFLEDHDINYRLNTRVQAVSTSDKTVKLSDGTFLSYDKLCVATGGAPLRPQFKGIDHQNVLFLRSGQDQGLIKQQAANAKNIVVIGQGFIGSETASALKMHFKEGVNVHLVGKSSVPLERQLGVEVGTTLNSEHVKHGVLVHNNRTVAEIKGDGQRATSVVLDDGQELAADLVIVGTGLVPSSSFLQGTDVSLDSQGGVIVDPFLQTSNKDIFAAGDIATYPDWQSGDRIRVEHYITAQDQGSHAAFNMMGKLVPYGNVPFFWTRHYNKAIQYIGHAQDYDRVHIEGSLADFKYVAYYIKGNKIVAMAGQQSSSTILTYLEAMKQNQMPSADDVISGKENADSVKARLKKNTGGGRCSREHCCKKKATL